MSKLLAQLKNGQNVIVLGEDATEKLSEIYKTPNVTKAREFAMDGHVLAEDEWHFVILTTDEQEKMLRGYESEASIGLDPLTKDNCSEVKVLYLVNGHEKIFSKVGARHVSKAQRQIAFGDEVRLMEEPAALSLTGQVDAYWNGARLFFKKFSQIQSLFPGIIDFYRQATETETNAFLSSALFELREEMSGDRIGSRSRKLIADIMNWKGNELADPAFCEKYLNYAKEYNLDLEIENDKIALIDNSDVAQVLGLLGEYYYTSAVSGEHRMTKASKKLVHARRKRAK